jgi:hypothetical protein
MGSWRTAALQGITDAGAIAKIRKYQSVGGGAAAFRRACGAGSAAIACHPAGSVYCRALMKIYAMLLLAAYGFFAASCERHEFEGPDGTKQIHDGHGGSAHSDAEHAEAPAAE